MISDAATRVVLIRIESIGPQRPAVIAPVTTRDRNRLTQAKDGRRLQIVEREQKDSTRTSCGYVSDVGSLS